MVITIFRSRLRPEHEKEYGEWATRIHDLAIRMPGFISIKTFNAEDGERVSLVEFESEETMRTGATSRTISRRRNSAENCFIPNTTSRSASPSAIIPFRKKLA